MGKLVSIADTARRFGKTEQTVRNWIANGYLKVKRVGNSTYFDEDTLDALNDSLEDVERAKRELNETCERLEKERMALDEDYKDEIAEKRLSRFITRGFNSHFFCFILDIMRMYGDLTDREVEVLYSRLKGDDMEEVAARFGISRERCRQIAEKAVRKSRNIVGLKEDIDSIAQLKADNASLLLQVENLSKVVGIRDAKAAMGDFAENEEVFKKISKNIVEEDFTVRVTNCMRMADVKTIGDIIKYGKLNLFKARNFGKKSLTEIDDYIENNGLSWDLDVDAVYDKHTAYLLTKDN